MDSRRCYFDFLRLAGTFAVIAAHVAAREWYTTDVHALAWQAMNFWDGIMRCSMSVFVMISGALFLNPGKIIPVRKLYSKYIFRIFTAFVFWSLLRGCIDCSVREEDC